MKIITLAGVSYTENTLILGNFETYSIPLIQSEIEILSNSLDLAVTVWTVYDEEKL